jgi:cytochrome P450
MSSDTLDLPLDLLSPAYVQDPGPMIDRLHAEAPVCFDPRLHGWIVGGYADVEALQRDGRLTSARASYVRALTPPELQARVTPLVDWFSAWMVMRDGAAHRRLRSLAAHAFQPRALQRLEARIDAVVDERLDAALARGEIEAVSDLAYPVPRVVICEMLGIPAGDQRLFDEWTPAINELLRGALTHEDVIARVERARAGMHDYFVQAIAERRRAPREGEVLSELVRAMEAGDSLTEDEVIDLVAFIMAGAYDTTALLVANGLVALLRSPDQLAALRADPTRVDAAVEEALRLDPPITVNTRAVAEPLEHRGHRFEPGHMVYFVVLAANRDPARFPDPHRFDLARPNLADHLSFGFGAHFCIGAALARLEARRVLHGLLRRTRELALPEQEIRRIPNMVVRGPEAVRVVLR